MAKCYWLKLKKDFFQKHDVKIIEAMPNGKDYVLFYLKLLCESTSHDGNLRFSEEIPYNEEMLSALTNTNIDIVRSAVKVLSSVKLMEMLDDGTYFMTKVNEMLGSETSWSEKKRIYREKQKQLSIGQNEDNVLKLSGQKEDLSDKILDNRYKILYKKETISKDIVKKKNETNVATLTQKRKDEFYQSLIPFLEKYEKEMVRDFFEYWSEPNQAKTKMRFEMEKTWDTERRLATWAKRDNKFNNNGSSIKSFKQAERDYRAEQFKEFEREIVSKVTG